MPVNEPPGSEAPGPLGWDHSSHPGRPSYTHSRPFAQKVLDALRWKMFQQPSLSPRLPVAGLPASFLGSLRQLPGQLPQAALGGGGGGSDMTESEE